ncbi:MAG: RidA family protein [Beijerinckiaceae bacterium]
MRFPSSLWAACIFFTVMMLPSTVSAQPDSTEFLNSGKIVPKGVPFSEAVRAGNTLYLSGFLGNVPGAFTLAPGGIRGESQQVMENIRTALGAAGYQMSNVVRCVVMLADIAEWEAFNDVYRTFFTGHFPARSAFGGIGLALGARVEVECTAVKG